MPHRINDTERRLGIVPAQVDEKLTVRVALGEQVAELFAAGADEVVLSVSDTGIGLRPEDVPSLFQMFSQVGDAGRGGGFEEVDGAADIDPGIVAGVLRPDADEGRGVPGAVATLGGAADRVTVGDVAGKNPDPRVVQRLRLPRRAAHVRQPTRGATPCRPRGL